jgi:hypothetical protein
MSLLHGDTVIIVRAPYKVDKYGNTTTQRDWANATRTTVARVSVQPDSSAEATGDRTSVITGWRLFTSKGRDFPALPGDRIEFDGMTLEVDGEVGRYRMGSRVHHVEARLRRVVG